MVRLLLLLLLFVIIIVGMTDECYFSFHRYNIMNTNFHDFKKLFANLVKEEDFKVASEQCHSEKDLVILMANKIISNAREGTDVPRIIAGQTISLDNLARKGSGNAGRCGNPNRSSTPILDLRNNSE